MKKTAVVFKADAKIPEAETISPDSTLQEAAAIMRDRQSTVLRVAVNGYTDGIISAYDIIAKAVAHNKTATKTKVREIMSRNLLPGASAAPDPIPVKAVQAKTGQSRKPGRLAFASGIKM